MLNRPEVGAAAYHALSAGPWGLFYDRDFVRNTSVTLWRTGMADLLTSFKPLHGGQVVESRLVGARTAGPDATCAAAALRNDKALYVVLVNREATAARRLTIELPESWRIAGGTTFTGPDLDAVDGPDARPLVTGMIAASNSAVRSWILPARHFAILQLERQP
jgi:hypothetical protein